MYIGEMAATHTPLFIIQDTSPSALTAAGNLLRLTNAL